MQVIDPRIKEWATERQCEYIDAVNEHGSNQKAAAALGLSRRTVDQGIKLAKAAAAKAGYAPEQGLRVPYPDGFKLGKATIQQGPDGRVERVWARMCEDTERQLELMRLARDAFLSDAPSIPVIKGPSSYNTDVIPWIQIGDAHLGLLCHAAEVGENFNLEIAERELCAAISILIDELPNSERIVINDLGDFTHYKSFSGISESGNVWDFDRRYSFMIPVYSRVMRFIVDRALTKARHVDVIVNQGNHSRENDIWMAELLRVAYGHTGRVHVLNNGSPFIAYRMGNTLVMTHHSDKCKPKDLVNVMTTDFRVDYGQTAYHYIDIGHVHHAMVLKEHPGVVVESFNHLATTDKWAHDLGYRARKSISAVFRSRKYGEVGRRLLPIQEIRDRLGKAHGAELAQHREVFSV